MTKYLHGWILLEPLCELQIGINEKEGMKKWSHCRIMDPSKFLSRTGHILRLYTLLHKQLLCDIHVPGVINNGNESFVTVIKCNELTLLKPKRNKYV